MGLPARKDSPPPPWIESLEKHVSQGMSTAEWCRLPDSPCEWTLYAWIRDNEKVKAIVHAARRYAVEHLLKRMEVVADGPGDAEDSAVRVNRDRLRLDQLRYLAAAWDPERFGNARSAGDGNVSVTVITGVPESVESQRQKLIVEAAKPAEIAEDVGDE